MNYLYLRVHEYDVIMVLNFIDKHVFIDYYGGTELQGEKNGIGDVYL